MKNPNNTHLKSVGYILWLFGFTGSHRFYYGKPITGTIWFFTFGLLLVGWIIDLFLIPSMDREADVRFHAGRINYTVAWVLLTFLGILGIHRIYMGKWISGIVYLLFELAAAAVIVAGILLGVMPASTLLPVALLVAASPIALMASRRLDDRQRLIPLMTMNLIVVLVVPVLLSVSLLTL